LSNPASVTILAAGTTDPSLAVTARIDAFRDGLRARGWPTRVVEAPTASPSWIQLRMDRWLPARLLGWLEALGVNGELRPRAGLDSARMLREVDTDILLVSVPPFSLALAAALTLPRRTRLVVDYRDPWNARLRPPLLARALRPLERHALLRAAAITFAGDAVLGQLTVTGLAARPERVHAVANGIDPHDLSDIRPDPPVEPSDHRPLDLVFAGQWYGRHGPGILSDGLAAVGPEVARLEVLGYLPGSVRDAMLRALPAGSVRFSAPQPRPRLYERLRRADAAIITLEPATAVESCLPAKVYDCLAVGIPVLAICPPGAALLRMDGAARFHHVHHDDYDALVALLRRMQTDRSVLRRGTVNPRAMSRQPGLDELNRVLQALT
jgi:hypothetical protein